jgi:hypothetical protein
MISEIKKNYKEFILCVELSILLSSIIIGQSSDVLLITFLVFLITLAIVISTYVSSKKYKLILKFSAIVIFLHFLLIPLLCILVLKKDSQSFRFETDVVKSEREISIENNEKRFAPKELIEKQRILNAIFNSNSSNLSKSVFELNNQIIVVDSFYIFKRGKSSNANGHPVTTYEYVICNSTGNFVLVIPAIEDESVNIKVLFKTVQSQLIARQIEYMQSDTNIKTGKFWTISQIISYTITFSDMKPISRAANWIYWFHYFIVAGFFISFLSSLFRPDVPKNS